MIEILHIDDSDDVAEKNILESGSTVASRSSNLKPSTDDWLCHLESKCDTSGTKSHITRVKTPECSITDGETFGRRDFADVPNFLVFFMFQTYNTAKNAL